MCSDARLNGLGIVLACLVIGSRVRFPFTFWVGVSKGSNRGIRQPHHRSDSDGSESIWWGIAHGQLAPAFIDN